MNEFNSFTRFSFSDLGIFPSSSAYEARISLTLASNPSDVVGAFGL